MRSLVPLCLAGLGLVAAACSGNSPAAPAHAPAGSPALAPTYSFHPGGESLVAQFRLTIDPAALTATAEPVAGRSGQAQPPQALSYDLDIANFLKPDSFEVTSVGRDVAGDLTLGFIHRHPFPAPDFSRPISGQNRADLGYTGRLLVLADVNTRSFFGDVTTDPTLVKAPDGYLRTGDLLAAQGLAHNTFPYVLLADDGEDNRITATNNTPLSNGGTPQGTYDPAVGGWQRSNIGAGLGWTGYDYLHAGQGATNTLTLYASAMSAAPLSLDVAVLIKYTDPRGQGGRSLRFPPVDFDVTQFAYRLPYAALDASKISRPVSQPIPIATTTGATAQVVFDVRDWDKAAAEAADANLSDEFDVTLIEPGASGVPTAELQVPALNPTPAIILPTTTSPTGMPGNEIPYAGSITKTLGGGSGVVWGLLRVTDPSHTTDDSAYHFGVDPASIIPSASRALDGRTYQAIPFSIGGALNPPQVLSVSPTGIAGCPGASVTFGADVTNSPSTWSWNFGGGATPNTSVAPNPVVTLGAIGTYNGTLTVTNGAGSSGPFSFSYTIGASAWAGHFLPSPTGGEGHYPSVVIYNGKPAVASVRYGGGSNDLQIAFASTGGPSNGGEWSGHTIASYAAGGSSIDTSCDLELLNGRLAVLFKNDATNRLSIAVATVTSPAVPTASDWVVYEIDSTVTALRDTPALTAHNGKLAAAYGDESPDDLWLAQATVDPPLSASDWTKFAVETSGNRGNYCDILSYNDGTSGPRIYIAHRDWDGLYPRISKATTLTPSSAADFVNFNIQQYFGGRANSLAQTTRNGQPALALSHLNWASSGTGGSGLKLAVSTVPNPSSDADFLKISNLEPVYGSIDHMHGTDVITHNGKLMIAFYDHLATGSGRLGIASATTPNVMSAADFETVFPDTTGPLTGYYPQLVVLAGGAPALLHRYGGFTEAAGNGAKFALSACP